MIIEISIGSVILWQKVGLNTDIVVVDEIVFSTVPILK